MKILGINCSPNRQRSQTQRLIDAALHGAKLNGADVECINLCDFEIKFCSGCRACFKTGRCILKDDYGHLLTRMVGADGMVWGSPNYSFCVPARMKALIDRMADAIHCQSFDGKYCVAVATAGRDDEVITEYLKTVLLDFGSFVTGCTGAVVTQGPQAVDAAEAVARELGVRLAEDISGKRDYSDQRKLITENRRAFQQKVRENASVWKHEFEYWENLAWR